MNKEKILCLAIRKNGEEVAGNAILYRTSDDWSYLTENDRKIWCYESDGNPDEDIVELPKGTIKKITGVDLKWENEPIIIKFL